jgi:WD40 repeat protein
MQHFQSELPNFFCKNVLKIRTLTPGHPAGRLSALATHPDRESSFLTTGYDKMVTKWRKQKILWQFSSTSDCLAADFHPNGSVIALSTLDGQAVVLNAQTGTQVW